jgi:putative peptide zinc metalloprotease protein
VPPRPKLRSDLSLVEQRYRGETTYIVKDPASKKYFRFKPLEVLVMQQFTGEATSAEVADALREQGLPLAPKTVDGFVRKLKQLGLLERSLAEKSVLELERLRAERRRRTRNTHYQGSLLRMRFSVGDPDGFFTRWLPRVRWFFSRSFLALSVALFAVYAVIFVRQFGAIFAGMRAMYSLDFFTLSNIVVFWGTGMVVIVIHELGHGFACKYFGGQVYEMGAMLIYFEPAFYCNVNDAWTFPERHKRLWVTAAGSWIQLVIAALAAIVWLLVDPVTLVSRIAFAALLIGGATTVLMNANPLIPLDGYYALSDYLEIPNLRQRALGHVAWAVKRHVLRLNVPEPPADAYERRAFFIYGVLALAYIATILFIFAGAVLGWAGRTLGALGVLAVVLLIGAMLRRGVREWARALVTTAREHRALWRERRVVRWAAGGAAVVLLLLLLVPWPIRVAGVYEAGPVRETVLAAPDDAELVDVVAGEGAQVAAGAAVARLRSFPLEEEYLGAARQADSLDALARVAQAGGRYDVAEQLTGARDEAATRRDVLADRLAALTLRAVTAATVVTPRFAEQVGRHYDAGDPVVRLMALDSLELRIRLERAGATAVRPGQRVAVLSEVGARHWLSARVAAVAAAGTADSGLEARVRIAAGTAGIRPGAAGRARITIRRTNLLGAVWWGLRKLVRNDVLL